MLRLSLPWVRFWGDALGYQRREQGAGGQGLPQQHSPIWDEQHAPSWANRPKSLWEPVTEL